MYLKIVPLIFLQRFVDNCSYNINIFSDCNWIRTHNHLVHKRTLNHLAKLAKWLSCVVSTYLYGAFDCIQEKSPTLLM